MNNKNSVREYGYIESSENKELISTKKGQYISGYAIGVLYLDECWYPVIPGNVANMTTYSYPVRFKVVPGCNQKRIHRGDPDLVDDIIAIAREFETEGAKAITAACGFFGNFQGKVAASVSIPVYLSSIIQVPWIKVGLKPDQKIGLLSADAQGITPELLKSCDVYDYAMLVIKDLKNLPEFSAIVESRGSFNNGIIRDEVVEAAISMISDNPDIGAILLECSDLPPYASDIQKATKVPVFDFISMINWIQHAVAQKPYCGFI